MNPVKKAEIGGIILAYRETGSGYPLLLINGLASAMDTWNPPVIDALSRQFRVIIFDNRGTGYSGASDEPLSIPLFAQDAGDLLESLGIARAHVLGFSMGACIALELTLQSPEKVDRLILVAGDCGGPEAARSDPEIFSRLADKNGTMEEVAGRMFPLLFPPEWLASHDPYQYCPAVEETTKTENAERQLESFRLWSGSFSRMGRIQSPTLVITGNADIVVPPGNSAILCDRIPESQLVTLHGGGHGLMYQFPEQFSRTVLGFLAPLD